VSRPASRRPAATLSPVSVELIARIHDVLGQADQAARLFTARLRAHDVVIDQLAAYINDDDSRGHRG
jgi:hypothetical protein